jgi:GNAT superfamily N-acetyltransferase
VRVAIRAARPGDEAALTAIAHAAKRHWGYAENLIARWRQDLTLTAHTIAEDQVYCAERDGEVVGFHTVSEEGGVFELEHLWVVPAHMGGGIGASLLRHAADVVRSRGGRTLRITSDPHAEGFYRRMNARPVGHVESTPPGRLLPVLELDCAAGSA